MCDQKFKFCENQPTKLKSDCSVSSAESDNGFGNNPQKQNTLRKKKTQAEQLPNTQNTFKNVICDQPYNCYPNPHQCCRTPHKKCIAQNLPSLNGDTVQFDNKTSTLNFPPSFNLKSDKKSTPICTLHQRDQTCIQMTPASSPLLKTKTKSNEKQTKIQVEVHRSNESQTNQTDEIRVDDNQSNDRFYSM